MSTQNDEKYFSSFPPTLAYIENSPEINQWIKNKMKLDFCVVSGLLAHGWTECSNTKRQTFSEINVLGSCSHSRAVHRWIFGQCVSSEREIKRLPSVYGGSYVIPHTGLGLPCRCIFHTGKAHLSKFHGLIAGNLFLFSWKITTSKSNVTNKKKNGKQKKKKKQGKKQKRFIIAKANILRTSCDRTNLFFVRTTHVCIFQRSFCHSKWRERNSWNGMPSASVSTRFDDTRTVHRSLYSLHHQLQMGNETCSKWNGTKKITNN